MLRFLCFHLGALLGALLLGALLVSAAQGQTPVQLLPGVTWEHEVELTPHGPVAFTVITAPPPTGLYTLGPVLAQSTITGGRATVTQIEQSIAASASVVGINGDFTSGSDSHPSGIVISGGQMSHGPTPARSSIGFDTNGGIHLGRLSFTGTVKGTGQRRPLAGVNQQPRANQIVLFTPAWGASTPALANAAVAVLEPFPAATINSDLTAVVTATPDGSTPIPADGAVLVATGSAAASLQAEAPVGTSVTVRLILPPSWGTVVSALGGGPLLVRGGKAIFTTSESFASTDLTGRDARAAVGQLKSGRVLLVAVDGGRPGYSVGMTTYELAQTMVRLGAVNAAAVAFGVGVTAAANGRLVSRPSSPLGARPVKEALLLQYAGVVAQPPSVPAIGKGNAAAGEQLSYSIVRPSTVTATVIGPDGVSRVLDTGARDPGTYRFSWTAFDAEGTWHWNVQATDDENRQSTADQTFVYDLTLTGLTVPASVAARTGLTARFTLSRPADVTLQIETPQGTVVTTEPAVALQAGAGSVTWDGTTSSGASAPSGAYVARVTDTSTIATVAQTARFTLHR